MITHVSQLIAAKLTGLDRGYIGDLVRRGKLRDHRGTGRNTWSLIPIEDVNEIRGKRGPVTAYDIWAAKAALREIRNRQPCRRRESGHRSTSGGLSAA